MNPRWISLAATAVTAVAQLLPQKRKGSVEKLAKPLIVAPYMLARRDPVFTLGCLMHLAGDVELMRADGSLQRGAAYFGAGHLAFLARCVRRGDRPRVPWLYAAAVAGMAPVIRDPKLIAYGAVLAAYSSVAKPPVGGVLFMASDALIELGQHVPSKWGNAAVMTTYGLAQNFLLGYHD